MRWRRGRGTPGRKDRDGWYHYEGVQLHAHPGVARAVEAAPELFVDLDDAADPTPRELFLGSVGFATKDGRAWDVWLDDDHRGALLDDAEDDLEDLVTASLAAHRWVVRALHPDTELYEVTARAATPAPTVVAAVYRALGEAHVELRRRQQR